MHHSTPFRFRSVRPTLVAALATSTAIVITGVAAGSHPPPAPEQPASQPAPPPVSMDWRETEKGLLENHVQLTFAEDFYRAGEAYFSPDMQRIIFQAVRAPARGEEPAEYYAMFLADVVWTGDQITGMRRAEELSPPDSANTCGWFDPNDENIVYFGSTIAQPTASSPPGYDRSSGRYRWMFPPEMRIVRCDLSRPGRPLEVIIGDEMAYQAEDGTSPDGRFMIYCSLESGGGDLFVRELDGDQSVPLVTKEGYDGGPFFSPDGRRICYRSDRAANHLLQIYVADLAFDDHGMITGIEREYQLSANEHVNWGPYWHPSGRFLIYSSSAVGHHNYEVFVVDADPGDLDGSPGPIRYGTRKRRVTHADGADVLPVFSPDGRHLLWTAQRDHSKRSQVWVANFAMPLD